LPTFGELKNSINNLESGGFFKPTGCNHREKLAIIIPYRDRESNLVLLLKYLHPLLQKQMRYYRIILIEQVTYRFLFLSIKNPELK
jgi:beta-1,4-galactosyltransferase 1